MNDEPIEVFDSRQFHQSIVEVSRALFADGYYASAIFEATKRVETEVRAVSGLPELMGKNLMAKAFAENDPKIKLSDQLDEQEGFKLILMGMMQGIRNPKAHYNISQEDFGKTLDYLGLMSLLLRRIDERVYPPNTGEEETEG